MHSLEIRDYETIRTLFPGMTFEANNFFWKLLLIVLPSTGQAILMASKIDDGVIFSQLVETIMETMSRSDINFNAALGLQEDQLTPQIVTITEKVSRRNPDHPTLGLDAHIVETCFF